MASNDYERSWDKRPAFAGRFGVPRRGIRFARFLAAPLALAVVVFAASQLASYAPKTTPAPAFVNHALGVPQPHAPLTRRPAPGVKVTIHKQGFTYDAGSGGTITLTDPVASGEAK